MWVSKNAASKGHDVTLISARGSSAVKGAGGVVLPSNLNIIETIEPSWEGVSAEEALSHVQGTTGKRIRKWKCNSMG